jgi:hypothetical protein
MLIRLTLAAVLVTSVTLAEPAADPCREAADLAEHIEGLAAVSTAIHRAARPICRAKDKPRCRRMIAELEEIAQFMAEANVERHAALAACKARKKDEQ